jgi:hypothetical protein
MAVSTIGSTNGPWSVSNSTVNDIYGGQRFYEEQERRYREEMERQRHAAMQNAYCINTDTYVGISAQEIRQESKPVKVKQPEYLNNKLLLLEI